MTDNEDIKEILKRIENKLDTLIEKMEISVEGSNKISEHIDFVENVFDTVKTPLSYICNKVSIFATKEQGVLEDIPTTNQILSNNDISDDISESHSEDDSEDDSDNDVFQDLNNFNSNI